MILKLTLPFMSFEDVSKIRDLITKDDIKFYFIERFNLKGNDVKIIQEELELYPALMERLVDKERMIEKVLSNQFITDARLKVRMYLALKRNDNRLLKYYNDNFYMLNDQIKNIQLTKFDIDKLLTLPFPFNLDDRLFRYSSSTHTITIKNTTTNNVICIVDISKMEASLVENGDQNKDIWFMLTNIEFIKDLLDVYNNPKKRKMSRDITNGHRRPKIRRR